MQVVANDFFDRPFTGRVWARQNSPGLFGERAVAISDTAPERIPGTGFGERACGIPLNSITDANIAIKQPATMTQPAADDPIVLSLRLPRRPDSATNSNASARPEPGDAAFAGELSDFRSLRRVRDEISSGSSSCPADRSHPAIDARMDGGRTTGTLFHVGSFSRCSSCPAIRCPNVLSTAVRARIRRTVSGGVAEITCNAAFLHSKSAINDPIANPLEITGLGTRGVDQSECDKH